MPNTPEGDNKLSVAPTPIQLGRNQNLEELRNRNEKATKQFLRADKRSPKRKINVNVSVPGPTEATIQT